MKIISVNWKNESSNKIFLCNLINFCLKTKSEESTGSRWDSSNSRPELKDNVSVSVKCLQLFLLSHPRAMTRKPCQIFISDHVADKKHRMYNVPTSPFPILVCWLWFLLLQNFVLLRWEVAVVWLGDPPQCLMLVSHNGNLLITVRNTINRIKNTV